VVPQNQTNAVFQPNSHKFLKHRYPRKPPGDYFYPEELTSKSQDGKIVVGVVPIVPFHKDTEETVKHTVRRVVEAVTFLVAFAVFMGVF